MATRILVTGGAGFLGSHLCEALLADGGDVICLDDFSTGSPVNLESLLDNRRFTVVRHDVALPFQLKVDQIYNLACPASPAHYQADPLGTVKTSVLGALNMAKLATAAKARLLQASTSEIYGDPEVHPQPEEYWGHVNPIGVRSCYDEGKRCAETIMFDYKRHHGLNIAVARIFNTYGPRMHPKDGRVVSNFIVQALQGKPITIYGSGLQTRSFCYVTDLIEGLRRLMDNRRATGPINLGNPTECTVLALARLVIDITGSKSRIVHKKLPTDDPRQRRPAIEKAQQLLKWCPAVPLTEGLGYTIAYFERRLSDGRRERRVSAAKRANGQAAVPA
ncbi:UDP-glucuronic acid decarboxylase family protein [Dongia deserti]|uniref:UDP-glucuronic acid decarboxylase family protein n=1 Tax=Dongia deserti TaxID=2268030 RepID=UPI000E647684|nr:UDP-glucuronic acid decarboxylase family protein [Dongia deserti]